MCKSGASAETGRALWYVQGQRGSLPSASIMLRQPMQRFSQMQASDIDIYRNEIRKTKNEIVSTLLCCNLTANSFICSNYPAGDVCQS